MTAEQFVEHLRQRDIHLRVEDGKLKVNAPEGALTETLRAELKGRRDELIAWLLRPSGVLEEPPPMTRASRTGPLPLSFAQQRLWLLDQLEPGSALYNLFFSTRYSGPLNVTALERTIQEIIRRHETLRTTFQTQDGWPVQVIGGVPESALNIIDLVDVEPPEREGEARRRIAAESVKPFDLVNGPLFHAALYRIDDGDHILACHMHHILSDGWSLGVFNRELTALYKAFSSNRPSPLPELPVQYVDFAAWQRNWLQGDVLAAHLDYWRRQFEGAPAAIELPSDRARPARRTYGGAWCAVSIPRDLAEAVRTYSRREGVTLFMTLLAAYQVLLARYSGQSDIVTGTPIANRNRPEIENLIGFFVNTLALRTTMDRSSTFTEVVRRVRDTALGAYAHQDLPFEQLVAELQPERETSHTPVFQVMFVLQNARMGSMVLEGTRSRALMNDIGQTKFDLTLTLMENGADLLGTLQYNTDIFEAETARRFAGHFVNVLRAALADPERAIWRLEWLDASERERILVEWNATTAPVPSSTVHALFEAQVRRTPEAVALVHGGRAMRYSELDACASRLAAELQGRGIAAGTFVGLATERSFEMVTGLLAVLKAGGAYVPVDPTQPAERLAFILDDANATLVLTESRFADTLGTLRRPVLSVNVDTAMPDSADRGVRSAALPAEAAYVLYTSGSTGRPKGVVVEHRQVVNYVWGVVRNMDLPADATYAMLQPLTVDSSVTVLMASLLTGGTLHLISGEMATDAPALRDYFEREGIDCLKIAPTHLAALESSLESGHVLPRRCLVIGGEASRRDWADQLGMPAGATLFNHYGPTETTVGVTMYRVQADLAAGLSVLPIGRPLMNSRAYLLDSELEPVPAGVPGDLYFGGAGLARGYLNRPDLTAQSFIPDPFSTGGERLYRTGDRARFLSDGNIEFLGRGDDQVKIRGFRIELKEVEAGIASHAGVREVLVLAREDRPGDRRLVAYVVPHAAAADTEAMRAHAREQLPDYMVPAAFVMLDALPRTPHGKIDRKALPAPDLAETPESGAPRTVTEEVVASIFASVLDLPRIGLRDNFFELGGHSLKATQVHFRLRHALHVELPLRLLFESPTVEGIARRVDAFRRERSGLTAPAIVPVDRSRVFPLSYAQQRLWFLNQLDAGRSTYNMPRSFRIRGPLDAARLERAIQAVVDRHESLRTTFRDARGTPVQVLHPSITVTLSRIDLRNDSGDRLAEARRRIGAEAALPFDLEAGPLFRLSLYTLDDDDHVLLTVLHHIVADGWSMALFSNEIQQVYDDPARGAAALPPLPVQYADFAYWQRSWLSGDVLEGQLDYWRKSLGGMTLARLETASDPGEFRGGHTTFLLPPEVAEALEALSRKEGVTLYMTLLAAVQTLIHRESHQDDIVVGTDIANRNRAETERLIGFFVNLLVLRTDLGGNPTFRDLLARVREVTLGAYEHQDVPFEKLVEILRPERATGDSSLFQVLFVYQNVPVQSESPGTREGLVWSPFGFEADFSKFELTMFMNRTYRGIGALWTYHAGLFTGKAIQRLAGRFEMLLREVAANPDRALRDIPIIPESEQREAAEERDKLRTAGRSRFQKVMPRAVEKD